MAMKSRPLVKFREAVRECLADGIVPTPQALKDRGHDYTDKKFGRSFSAGYYAQAREEEFIKAGWRRMQFVPDGSNFRWLPIKRKSDKSEGHRVVSAFRVGDVVRFYNSAIIDANPDVAGNTYQITGYESGALLDRDDLPRGATALCVEVGKNEHIMCWDDELTLVQVNPAFPLRRK